MRVSSSVVLLCILFAACDSSDGAKSSAPALGDASLDGASAGGSAGATSQGGKGGGSGGSSGQKGSGGATRDASRSLDATPGGAGGAVAEAGTPAGGDTCAASDLNAAITVGCNGPIPGPKPAGQNDGSCDATCAAGLVCALTGAAPGLCVAKCDPAATYVSKGNCSPGNRCFTVTPTTAFCLPDCKSGSDCAGGSCTTDGACAFPIEGPDGAVSSCIAGGACQNGDGNGLCDGISCNTCNDPTDDAKCATVYGAGALCLKGVCAPGACRSSAECGGKPCTNNQCSPCTTDGQCTAPNTICNTTSGTCVTSASCSTAADNAACPVNAGDVCCSAVCVPGACCGSGPCTVKTANDGTCSAGDCKLNACAAPPNKMRFVDPGATAGGNGSKSCPYAHVGSATSDLAASGGTVVFRGGSTSTFSGTAGLPDGVTVVGSDSNFDPCTSSSSDTKCTSPTSWAKINETSVYDAFAANSPGTRTVHYLQVTGDAAISTSAGIGVNPSSGTSTVSFDHVRFTGFKWGIYAANGGKVSIGADVQCTGNTFAGLQVSTGAVADVELKAGDKLTSFSSNVNSAGANSFGIYVDDTGKLTVNGPAYPASSLVFANSNRYGVRFASSTSGSSITGLTMSDNTVDGMYLYAKSILKVRGSYFVKNGHDGVRVVANGTNVANGFTALDLGTTDAGQNTFKGNTYTGLCVDAAVAVAATNRSLNAQGNFWGTTCTASAPTGTFTISGTCGAGVDESADCSGAVNAAACTAKFVDPGGVCAAQ